MSREQRSPGLTLTQGLIHHTAHEYFTGTPGLSPFLGCLILNILPNFCCSVTQFNFCCCSVTQLCPILCNPVGCSMPGFRVLNDNE